MNSKTKKSRGNKVIYMYPSKYFIYTTRLKISEVIDMNKKRNYMMKNGKLINLDTIIEEEKRRFFWSINGLH
jgi:hypothetical protein